MQQNSITFPSNLTNSRKKFYYFGLSLLITPKNKVYNYEYTGIEEYTKIYLEHTLPVNQLTSFCINQWLKNPINASKIADINTKTDLNYWINNDYIKEFGYFCIKSKNIILCEVIIAVAYDHLYIISLNQFYSMNKNIERRFKIIQIDKCILFSKKNNMKGIGVTVPNPENYSLYTQFNFVRQIPSDTGLPLPFLLSF